MDGIFDISIDYEKIIRQANKLSKIAGDCKNIKNDINMEARFVEYGWKGKTGESLSEKLKALEKKTKTVADNLSEVSRTMKRVANDIRQSDLDSIARIDKI